jgi:hypothetical protein
MIRQSSFIVKMSIELWIWSPAMEGTLRRGIQRYKRFLRLFNLYPRKMLVPTLEIDLVWHTHQLSPLQYFRSTVALTGRFIDHNDKLDSTILNPGLKETSNLYRMEFAETYSYCNCWDCEAFRSAVEEAEHLG